MELCVKKFGNVSRKSGKRGECKDVTWARTKCRVAKETADVARKSDGPYKSL